MIKGIQLTLMVGPVVAVPAPRAVVDALTSVEVTTASGDQASGFELNFSLDKRSPLHTLFLLSGGSGIPLVRVILVVTVGATPQVLVDGVMTHHQVQPGSAGAPSTLRIQGKDLSAVMDQVEFDGVPYPAMSPALRALAIIAKYAWLGIAPAVVPSVIEDIPIPLERVPLHTGTDLDYLQRLARECGYTFYLEPGPVPGASVAYWGPELRVGEAQPALNVDMDAHTNVESLSFRFEKEAKETPIVFVQEPFTKATLPIPIPDVTPLSPPLGLVPPIPPRLKYLDDTGHLSPLRAALRGVAYAAQHADAVFATGSLDVLRYGRLLKSRRLVGVRGAGQAFDGLYYVKSVTHTLERGTYTQRFELARNGLVSTLPAVPA